jgi:hypothetical protein
MWPSIKSMNNLEPAIHVPEPSLAYAASLCDGVGMFEHAELTSPRKEHGYCTDDVGRLLYTAVLLREDSRSRYLAEVALGYLERAKRGDQFANRCSVDGVWIEESSDDANGRALLGLGVAVGRAPWGGVHERARILFDGAVSMRPASRRAMSYAALGAGAALKRGPHPGALSLMNCVADELEGLEGGSWYESRLYYANALLPEAGLVCALATKRTHMRHVALERLAWLIEEESLDGHFSFSPVGGRDVGDAKPGFDQQPIEASVMAEACFRAWLISGDDRFERAALMAAEWFMGRNDTGAVMFDEHSGGCYDGLTGTAVNLNEGAESALSLVSALYVHDRITMHAQRRSSRYENRRTVSRRGP